MLFNSIEFAVFFPIVFSVYWLIGSEKYKLQNIWLLLCSYVFYGVWDWRFLILLFLSTVVDFFVARLIFITRVRKKRFLWGLVSVVVNLAVLAVFKYFNFFVFAFNESFFLFGQPISLPFVQDPVHEC